MGTEELAFPEVVYHYTTMDALLNIIDKRQLWATNSRYLNDESENRLFIEAVQGRLHVCVPGYADLVGNHLSNVYKRMVDLPFITSFTEIGDSLTHWRSYCPDGNGVSIGFNVACLLNAEANHEPEISFQLEAGTMRATADFGQIRYLDPSHHPTIDEAIHAAVTDSKAFVESNGYDMAMFPNELAFRIFWQAPFYKDHSFLNEREFRLQINSIRWRQDLLRFRTTRSTLVPYVLVTIPRSDRVKPKLGLSSDAWNAIDSITIGPTPNKELSIQAVEAFCETRGICPIVKGSAIPYRDW